jgi:hypothetical protein
MLISPKSGGGDVRLLIISRVASAMIGLDPARYSDIHHNGGAIEQLCTTDGPYFYLNSLTLEHDFIHLGLTPFTYQVS